MVDNPFEKAGVLRDDNILVTTVAEKKDYIEPEFDQVLTLASMFKQIWEYHDKLGHDASEDKMKIIREGCLALYQEVAELTDSFPWKPWRKLVDQNYNTDNACREIVDIFFFLAKIMRAAGITPEELIAKFYWVLNNNLNRLENGYSKIKESKKVSAYCEACENDILVFKIGDACSICGALNTKPILMKGGENEEDQSIIRQDSSECAV